MQNFDVLRLKEQGAIFFKNINEGLQYYQNEIKVMDAKEAYDYFQKKIAKYGEEYCFADFYYFSLPDKARKKIDRMLTERERYYLNEIQPKGDRNENIIFSLEGELLQIILKLNENEMLFSTIYLLQSQTNPRASYWGNYNREYVCFTDKEAI